MCPKVVIIGHGYTSRLGIIRSLAELDCEITVIAMVFHSLIGRLLRGEGGKPIDCCSSYVKRVLYCNAKDSEELIQVLLTRCTDKEQKVILIPDSDFSASVVDLNQERLKPHFFFPHISYSAGSVVHWMRKTEQKKLALRVGLDVAQDCTVEIKGGQYIIPEGIRFPCFTKPLATISGGKQFLKRCNNEDDLRRVLDRVICEYDETEILVEDYKRIDTEYAVVGFSDRESVVIPGVIEFITNSQSHFGIAREGRIIPVVGFESVIEAFKEFVRRIGFWGLFDIDFYKSEGSFYFGELNLRFGGSGYAYTAMGVNLPSMYVRSLIGESTANMKKDVTESATFVNERMCIDDWSFYKISEQKMHCILDSADIRFVYDENDLGPQKRFDRYIRIQRVKRVLRKWLNKV